MEKNLEKKYKAILISLNEIDQIVEADDIIGIEEVINENIDSLREFIAKDYHDMIEKQGALGEVTRVSKSDFEKKSIEKNIYKSKSTKR